MLESVKDEAFASLEDAYGPATLVPDLLRAAAGPREQAEDALAELAGGVFHQGGFFSATPLATRYLVALVSEGVPARANVLGLLGAMAAGFRPPMLAWNPYHFYATPGPPDHPEAAATLEVIVGGRAHIQAALADADPDVRAAAAYALSSLPRGASEDALRAALEREADDGVKVAFVLCLALLGQRVPPSQVTGLASDVAHVSEVLWLGARSIDALDALERVARKERLDPRRTPFEAGDVSTFALLALQRLASEPDLHEAVVSALWRTMHARLARGERFVEPSMPVIERVSDAPRCPDPTNAQGDDAGLRAVAHVLARLVVQEPAEGELLRRETLTDDARRVLSLTVDHGIPLPLRSAPWIRPETMRRFLAGGGPLDREVTVAGRRAPAYEHLYRLARPGDPLREATLAALAAACSDDQLFDLVLDMLSNAYPPVSGSLWGWVAMTELVPLVQERLLPLRARFDAYAEVVRAEPFVDRERACFALLPHLVGETVPEPAFDRLVTSTLALQPESRIAWLAKFPEPRRSRVVAASGSGWMVSRAGSGCDAAVLQREVLAAFVAPGCSWLAHEAETLLGRIDDVDALRAALADAVGRKRALLDRVVREKTGEGMLTLALREAGDGFEAVLTMRGGEVVATRTLTRALMPDEPRFVGEAIADPARTVIDIASELDETMSYQAMLRLGDVVACELRMGSTTHMPRDGGTYHGSEPTRLSVEARPTS